MQCELEKYGVKGREEGAQNFSPMSWTCHHLWRFPQRRRLAPGPSWQHLQSPLMSGICQHSRRTIGSQGHSQFVLDLIKSSQPYQLLKRKGEKCYKVPLARVRIAKKRKRNKRALTKETCSQDSSSSKAPFIQLFPQVLGENRVPSIAVSTDNMSLTPTWRSCSLSYSMFSPQTSYSFWDPSPLPSLLRGPLTPESRT